MEPYKKYIGEDLYIEIHNTSSIKRTYCPINIHVKLPVKYSYQEILYKKENLFDGTSLRKI